MPLYAFTWTHTPDGQTGTVEVVSDWLIGALLFARRTVRSRKFPGGDLSKLELTLTATDEGEDMPTIGRFKRKDADYHGSIRTGTLKLENVIIRRIQKASDAAPEYRVEVDGVELGAAWERTGKESNEFYLFVRIDDPSFANPVAANLFMNKQDPDQWELVWKRA